MNTALIEKIRRLRALSQSANVHEAAAAAAAAERLIQEHRISEAELDATDGAEAPSEEDLVDVGVSAPTWKAVLSTSLEKHHGCAGFLQKMPGGRVVFRIIGRPSDVSTVRYLYTWLVAEIERLCAADKDLSGRTARNSFRLGAADGVGEAMAEANREVRAAASGAALVRLDQRLEAAEEKLPENLRRGRRRSEVDLDALRRGQKAGRGLHLGQRLGEGGTKLLGGGS